MTKQPPKSIFSLLSFLLLGGSAVCAGLLLFWLRKINLLPGRYLLILAGALALFLFLAGALLIPPRKKARLRPGRRILSCILSLLLGISCLTGTYAVSRLHGTLSAITSTEKVYVLLEVYVLADDPALYIQDTGGYTFALADTTDPGDAEKTLSHLESLLEETVSTAQYPTPFAMIDALYAGEADAIILDSSYAGVLDATEGYTDFSEKTRMLHEYVIEKEVTVSPAIPSPTVGTTPFLLYISGNDARRALLADGGSDVNILAAVNPAEKQILLVNTPRDYYVENPASGNGSRDKLSHCGLHGIQNCIGAMEGLYGLSVDYYARINFSGFRTLVDALGGVTVYSDRSFTAGKHYIREGENFLNGEQALAFARERKNLPGGDNDRGKNQMKLITAMVNQLSASTLLLNYGGVLDSLEGMFTTSLPAEAISTLVQQQLLDLGPWEVFSFAVTGDNGNDRCWAVNGGYGYVMYPHENMVTHAAGLMNRVLSGETLTQEDLIVP